MEKYNLLYKHNQLSVLMEKQMQKVFILCIMCSVMPLTVVPLHVQYGP